MNTKKILNMKIFFHITLFFTYTVFFIISYLYTFRKVVKDNIGKTKKEKNYILEIDTISGEKNSHEFQSCLKEILLNANNPEIFMYLDYQCLDLLKVLHSFEYGKQGKSTLSKEFVNSLINLHEFGGISIYIDSQKHSFSPLALLQNYTFQYYNSFNEIKLWWEKIGRKHSRKEWAVERIENVLKKKKLDCKDRVVLSLIIGNCRFQKESEQNIKEWWIQNKGKTFQTWSRDAMKWSLDNIDNNKGSNLLEYEDSTLLAYTNLLNLLDKRILKKLGITNTESKNLLPTISDFKKGKKRIDKWFKNNAFHYNPMTRSFIP